MAEYKDVTGFRELFSEEYNKTRKLISQGKIYLDNLAEGFTGADKVIRKLPTADVVEVEKVEKAREEIISTMTELMSEYMKHGSGADYYAGYSESMETAISVVRAVFNNLLVSDVAGDAVELAESENKTEFLFSRRNKNE